ncbi:hypothetical protein [Nocardia altamirensis]|uniref:hypothetical protein n=1 Tax=Nocardia altamirensis TaxID=472158 RepID=UPI000840910B|nr:hypothetical protein [Nocardia altamirensis]
MALFPEIVAAYDAATDILADENVIIDNPHLLMAPTHTIEELMAAHSPAYSVELTFTDTTFGIGWNKRFGFTGEIEHHPYPCHYTESGYRDRLAEVLVPLVHDFQQRAQNAKLADYANDAPGSVYEARDAVRRLD